MFSVIESSTRKSASSRDSVATPGCAEEGGAVGVDGGAAWDGFVTREACAAASEPGAM